MREVKRSALVARSPSRMYELINDVESYPGFVPGCTEARVDSRTPREMLATLSVRRGPLHAQFTTRNELDPPHRVRMQLVKGPFRMLEGEWRLSPVGASGCRIELVMRFAFANPISGLLFEPLFEETAAALVDAFVSRARALDE